MNITTWIKNILSSEEKIEDIVCPVCGYYCIGNGGSGCIDKKSLYLASKKETK